MGETVNEYAVQRKALSDRLDAVCAALATVLGGTAGNPHASNGEINDHSREIRFADGRAIWLNKSYGVPRLSVDGVYPKDSKGQDCAYFRNGERPGITVAMDRPAEKIAADITRRFLPEYNAAYAKAVENVKVSNDTLDAAERHATEIARLFSGEVRGKDGRERFVSFKVGDAFCDARCTGTSVKLELNYLSPDTALALCRAIAPFVTKD